MFGFASASRPNIHADIILTSQRAQCLKSQEQAGYTVKRKKERKERREGGRKEERKVEIRMNAHV